MNQDLEQAARSRQSWRVAGIIVTVLVIGGGLLVAPALWAFVQQLDTTTERTSQTYPRVPERVTVEGDTAEIEIVGTAADEVAVERKLEWARAEPDVTESWQGDDLVVDLTCSGGGLFGWVSDVCRVDYRAEVPTSSALELTATTGDVSADGVTGDVDVTTTTGSIRADDLEGDRVVAQATTGSIHATELEADRVAAEATTGSIELEFTAAPREVGAEVTTGDIVVTVPDDGDPYRVVGETQTGERAVQIATDPSSDRVIDVSTSTGDVTIRYDG